MNSSDDNILPEPSDEQALKTLVVPFVEACPDMHDMAHIEAQGILDKYGIQHLDPDVVWWHRFDNTSVSSTRAFLFWQHYPKPIESLTLTQLVMQRFQTHDQDNADLLDSDGGFYREDANAQIYNETNEVKMYPSRVIKDLWRIDFHDRYWSKMEDFWRRHSDNYRTLAKLNFIAKALEEHEGSRLSNENLKTVLMAVASHVSWPMTLDLLRASEVPDEGLTVAPLSLGEYVATDILRIIDKNGRQILYIPGELDAFHVFEKPHDLHWWLLCQNNHADNRARFMSHFPLAAQQQNGDNVGLNHTIDLLYVTWGKYDHSLFDPGYPALRVDAFQWLRDSVKERMLGDAELSLRSNGDLREKMWIGYLSVFTRLFGAMSVAGWPVALAAVGAGIANIGLNLDQAINGRTASDRKSGVISAIFATIDTLFNASSLGGSAELAEVQEANDAFTPQENLAGETPLEPAGVPKIALAAPGRAYVLEGENPFQPFETNEVLDGLEPVATEGKYSAIYQPQTGGNYIKIHETFYQVRYVNELKSWVVIDPANPFSFHRSLPVRLNAAGEWEPLTRPGLYGGGRIFGKLPWGRSPAPLPEIPTLTSPYDMPQAARAELQPFVTDVNVGHDLSEHYWSEKSVLEAFKKLRRRLYEDAHAFHENLPPLPPRPTIPSFGAVNSSDSIIRRLLEEAPGLVIGEAHSSVGSKQFLIENMEVLSKQKVKTLYMEHLLNDFHQVDLDLFNQGKPLSKDLEKYLNELDQGWHTDPTGRFTFLNLVKAARDNHIRVQSIDCAGSYRVNGILNGSAYRRQEMMNFYAKTIIDADQLGRGAHRWVALVGNSHANTWHDISGLSELEGGISVRVESAPVGQPTTIEPDPGASGTAGLPLTVETVKNDLFLQLASPELAREQAIATALNKPGMITLEKAGSKLQLIHRSRDGSLVRTVIHDDGPGIYIDRPNWPGTYNKRFNNLIELREALIKQGLKMTRVP